MMKLNKISKTQSGITLVALIITVIILLILVGVAITAIIGEEGIFNKAKYSAEKYNSASKNEAEKLNELLVNGINTNEPEAPEPIADGGFAISKGINTPDTSKLPLATTKYATWTDTNTENLSSTVPTDWYDYKNSKWANIKTASTDGSLEAYWVWIPRFAYKLPENGITPKTIEVAFVKGNGTMVINPTTGAEEQAYYSTDTAITTDGSGVYLKKTAGAASKWIIHPAFTFGNNSNLSDISNTQLAGIWVAKYEASSSNPAASYGGGNTTNLKVQVKPSVTSWRSITAANSFIVCRAMQNTGGVLGTLTGTTTLDTHMMKNMEWGAIAILSQSKYGNYDRGASTSIQIWNNPNNSYITGTSGASKDQGSTANSSCYLYNTANGIKASTTGNIYGVYDMAGGAYDQVAGMLAGATALGSGVDKKYYDIYTNPGGAASNYDGGKIGDVTRELSPASSASWYGDHAYFPFPTREMFYRGGYYSYTTGSGMFAFDWYNGADYDFFAFRPTLVMI